MKNFWGYIKNNRFAIGCTGQTVYVYDDRGNELKSLVILNMPIPLCFVLERTYSLLNQRLEGLLFILLIQWSLSRSLDFQRLTVVRTTVFVSQMMVDTFIILNATSTAV